MSLGAIELSRDKCQLRGRLSAEPLPVAQAAGMCSALFFLDF